MRVLAAFDKFRDSISASEACDIAARAIGAARGETDTCPLSDGGEGFTEVLTRAAGGSMESYRVAGPRGWDVAAPVGLVSMNKIPPEARRLLGRAGADSAGSVAVIEMAAASGLALLAPGARDPLHATSAGTGQLIRAAAESGAGAILLGVGGSATSDMGLGALEAMGIGFSGESGATLSSLVPADWSRLRGIAGSITGPLPPIVIACDVDNPLLGPRGAVAIYGPQKGLKPGDAPALEAEYRRISALMCSHFGRAEGVADLPGTGAAGGITFGLMVAADAVIAPGFDLVAAWLDLDRRIAAADVILTGEGRFDDSSLSGKGPGAVVRRALALGKTVHVFAGSIALSRDIPGLSAHPITPLGVPLDRALSEGPGRLFDSVRQVLGGR